ncbi:uncharacterized protein PV06_05708 [Exophiala oligosperma]|uniref:Zn(2)-C6 fungal-type domain-containing protein n=1 Tax=Exophiala oligosperma TaxID=215243 RepID=A0A0D2DGJ1_9EURO|nr:uncharacterized protein PV06_05708 [Exophiala oligosperma]KIW42123.1 hypothetical protein PV06_05708 [Exophiala oligosperma]
MNAEQRYESIEVEAKRKRLRKGTHSCWECKRRKVRCTFASPADSTCITCQRRGTRCVGQDVPEEECPVEDGATGSMERVEALLNKLVKTIDHTTTTENRPRRQPVEAQASRSDNDPRSSASRQPQPAAPPTVATRDSSSVVSHLRTTRNINAHLPPPSYRTPDSQPSPISQMSASRTSSLNQISQALLAAFPSQSDIDILLKDDGGICTICPQISSMFSGKDGGGGMIREHTGNAVKVAGPHVHPVLLAKHMLTLSALLMSFPPHERIPGVMEHHHGIMMRLADTAINLVTTNEELLGSVESLECVLLEGQHHSNCGNIRRAWLAHRRALMVAQLYGVNRLNGPTPKRLDPEPSNSSMQTLWTHVIYVDRFVSLMLGLPPGNTDFNPETHAPPTAGKPRENLESLHAVVSVKIFQRNQLTPSQQVVIDTLDIDKELRKTAESLPANFWRPPEFTEMQENTNEALKETMRVRDHVTHFSLLNQLHLPYLLCPNVGVNEYSRTSCTYASREILSRFIIFRTLRKLSSCCRLADFLAVVAGITLVLAHIDSHRLARSGNNALIHQRLGDRATVEKALEKVEVISRPNDDMMTAKCADVLRRLLRIEADAAQWHEEGGTIGNAQGAEGGHGDTKNALFITGPYCGTFKVSNFGIEFLSGLESTLHSSDGFMLGGIGMIHVVDDGDDGITNEQELPTAGFPMFDNNVTPPFTNDQPHTVLVEDTQVPSTTDALPSDDFMMQDDDDNPNSNNMYPGVTTTGMMNEWTIPGVDSTFFDSLMMMQTEADTQIGGIDNEGPSAAGADWDRSVNVPPTVNRTAMYLASQPPVL